MAKRKLYLYWVTTDDHAEDWFMIADSESKAARMFESEEGYLLGSADAEMILTIPADLHKIYGEDDETWPWPANDTLVSLGAKFISYNPTRIVEISGRNFCEGLMGEVIMSIDDDHFESEGMGRPNGTCGGIGKSSG